MGRVTLDYLAQHKRMTSEPVSEHLAYLRLRSLSPATITQRRYCLTRLATVTGADLTDLLALVPDDLDVWQRKIAHLSPRYRTSQITHVSEFYRWAVHNRLLTESPCDGLVRPQLPRAVPHPISEDDLTMAISCAPPRLRLMLVLAAYAGLRAGEISRLDRQDIQDNAYPPVAVVAGKGNRERIVPLSSRVMMELRAHGLPHRGPLFPRFDGQPGSNSPARISRLCGQYLHGMGMGESLHALRHRFATATYQRSKDLRAVHSLMGHSSPTQTAAYAAYSSVAAVEAVEAICTEDPARRLASA